MKESEKRTVEGCNGQGEVAGGVAERNGKCFRGPERILLREPEDDADVDAVLELCKGGNGRACKAVVDVVLEASPLADIASTCGGTATLEGTECAVPAPTETGEPSDTVLGAGAPET